MFRSLKYLSNARRFSSKPGLKDALELKKRRSVSMLLVGIGFTVVGSIFITNYMNWRKGEVYTKGMFKLKYRVPPFERVVEDIERRDYEIPVIFTKDLAEKEGGDELISVQMEKIILRVQHRFALALSMVGNERFKRDEWKREDGSGGGVVRYIQGGENFEKGGINISVSRGELGPEAQRLMIGKSSEIRKFLDEKIKKGEKVPFLSASISSVIHPDNPHVPSLHFNYRYFEIGEKSKSGELVPKHWWFGGGCDLSPSILYEEDCRHFHSVYHRICEKFRPGSYKRFKSDCDDYFCIPYRKEHRGVGGVFFDELTGENPDEVIQFIDEMANAVVEAYIPILTKRCIDSYSEDQKRWQQIRRGRYAEFNIAIDRGTKFGRCRENANIEAIHISLPLKARFEYNAEPKSQEEIALMEVLKNPIDWIPLEGESVK